VFFTGNSSEEPNQLRGPQFHWTLADEVASWKYVPDDSGLNAWNNLRIATRLPGRPHPQVVAMTTPKRTEFMRELLAEEDKEGVIVIHGSTRENQSNLDAEYINMLYGLYGGTALARQELEGLMLDDVEGAMLTMEIITRSRTSAVPRSARLIVVGVDPSVSEKPRDECGIIVATSTMEPKLYKRHAYVLEDASVHGSPKKWAQAVVDTARRWSAPVIVETNQGKQLVVDALQTLDPAIKVIDVHARQGKQTRAEPVVSAYEQGRVHHVGEIPEYEDQFCTWVPDVKTKSPDRVDAGVYALTALLVKQPSELYQAPIRAHSTAKRQINTKRGTNASKRRSFGRWR
jgi:phage terminase large subunit-like protein